MRTFKTNSKVTALAMIVSAVIVALGLFLALGRINSAEADSSFVSSQSAPNPKLPTLFVVGDSTANNNANGGQGWGDPFISYFDATKINVLNRARGGRSSRTFQTEGLWDKVLAEMKPGDFALIQFGHNDGSPVNVDRARGSLPGIGDETQEIESINTKQREVVHTFGWYMRKFIADTKAKGATPIVLSLTVRNIWKDGKVECGSGKFGQWAAEVAKAQGAAFVDLNTIVANKYEGLGEEKVKELFATDHTHTSPAGAELNAASVVSGLKELKGSAFLSYLSEKGKAVNTYTASAAQAQERKTSFKFDFGPGKVALGYIQVLPATIYSREPGYGFEPGATISGIDRGGNDALRGDFCTSDKPFFFSVALPEGNYNVTVTLGDAAGETATTVKAELRRLMLEEVHTAAGKFETKTFTVNVRVPQIAGGGEVKLKDREKASEIWAWDEKLTLEFNNTRPVVNAIEITRADDVPTIFLLGDSTVCDQPSEPYNSWGQMLTRFFKPGVAIANHAESGESLKSSLGARRLDKVMSLMKPGDYLFIQYGHNDEKEKGEGISAFTSYKADLKRFIAEARKHGGVSVLVTPVQRRTFDAQGWITNSHGDYPEAVRQAAKEENVPLIDLHAMSTLFYQAMGPEKSKLAFKDGDGTHHNNYGSYQLAKCIVEGIKANKLGIVKYLMNDMPPFDPRRLDPLDGFKVPASPQRANIAPLGR